MWIFYIIICCFCFYAAYRNCFAYGEWHFWHKTIGISLLISFFALSAGIFWEMYGDLDNKGNAIIMPFYIPAALLLLVQLLGFIGFLCRKKANGDCQICGEDSKSEPEKLDDDVWGLSLICFVMFLVLVLSVYVVIAFAIGETNIKWFLSVLLLAMTTYSGWIYGFLKKPYNYICDHIQLSKYQKSIPFESVSENSSLPKSIKMSENEKKMAFFLGITGSVLTLEKLEKATSEFMMRHQYCQNDKILRDMGQLAYDELRGLF